MRISRTALVFALGVVISVAAKGGGIITTVAGKGYPPGFSGDGGPATSALLGGPFGGIAVDGFTSELSNMLGTHNKAPGSAPGLCSVRE